MKARVAFLHIPKAAGSTFRTLMFDSLGRDRVAWLDENISKGDMLSLNKQQSLKYSVVGGHITYREVAPVLGAEFNYFAVLREPVERAISAHSYVLRRPEHPLHNKIKNLSMLDAIRNVLEFRNEISNYQCFYLSQFGGRSALDAIRSIHRNRINVYTLENYTGFLDRIRSMLDLPQQLPIARANAAPPNSYDRHEYSDPALIERIRRINADDIQLYDCFSRRVASAYPPA